MDFQSVFERYEYKYIVTDEQKNLIKNKIHPFMVADKYGHTTVRNIYYDTDNYRLIRKSIEKPIYKEKIRVRSYETVKENGTVFVELKKKYKSLVYKRRVSLPEEEASCWLQNGIHCTANTQITNEIDCFLQFYGGLKPTVFLCYTREAYYSKNDYGFRVTFDSNILCRQENLSLGAEAYGTPILSKGMNIMEIKCCGGIPLWMTDILSLERIYKASFSKYGTAYKNIIFPQYNFEFKEGI